MKQRKLSLRTQIAALYAVVTLVAGLGFVAVNFAGIERDSAGLSEALGGVGVLAVVALASGWVIAGYAVAPLRELTETAQQVTAASLDRRMGVTGPDDEVQQLADTIDALLARLESSFERERRFVANASHEIRTPLAITRTALEIGLGATDPTIQELRDALAQALAATARSEALTADLLLLAQSENPTLARAVDRIDLACVVSEVLAYYGEDANERGVRLQLDLEPAPMAGIVGLVDRLVANLVDNAIRHNEPSGWVEVVTRTEQSQAVILVRNSATSCGPVLVDELFEPFRRGAAPSQLRPAGHGLGLSIVRAIARTHGTEPCAALRCIDSCRVFEIELRFDADDGSQSAGSLS